MAHEGTVYFDIRFTIVTPGEERIKLIINIEAQKSYYPGYDLVTRGVYYGHMLSFVIMKIHLIFKNGLPPACN